MILSDFNVPLFGWSCLVLLGGAQSLSARGVSPDDVKNVAIIGAGAAGSSAAYHLQRYALQEALHINITLFEKTDHIGGRTITVNPYDDPTVPAVELGASIFVEINKIIYEAAKEFDLPLDGLPDSSLGDLTAIWDGEQFVYENVAGTSFWWETTRMWWKYGTSPYYAMRLMKDTVGRFLRLYEEPWFPFRSLTQRCFELGLTRITGMTGEQLLAENKINPKFGSEIVQAATRVNYASNLAYIHGLEAMVSIATDGAVAVTGGNWQIFDHMVRRSGASFHPNTSVAAIAFGKGHSAENPKYRLSTRAGDEDSSSSSTATGAESFPITFDNVIIASPWQFSNISAARDVLTHKIDEVPYTKLHVTLFASPFQLSPAYFGLEPGTKAPKNVYTTLNERDEPKQGAAGVGSAGFYSVSTLRTVLNPKTLRVEYVYKIFSAEPVTAKFLSDLLGTEVPSTFVFAATSKDQDPAEPRSPGVEPISWYYPHWFHSYPVELPRVTFQDPILGSGLYYTSGIESFISTMETSALMGMNVARMIADDFSGSLRGKINKGLLRRPQKQQQKLGQQQQHQDSPDDGKDDFFESMENSFFAGVDEEL